MTVSRRPAPWVSAGVLSAAQQVRQQLAGIVAEAVESVPAGEFAFHHPLKIVIHSRLRLARPPPTVGRISNPSVRTMLWRLRNRPVFLRRWMGERFDLRRVFVTPSPLWREGWGEGRISFKRLNFISRSEMTTIGKPPVVARAPAQVVLVRFGTLAGKEPQQPAAVDLDVGGQAIVLFLKGHLRQPLAAPQRQRQELRVMRALMQAMTVLFQLFFQQPHIGSHLPRGEAILFSRRRFELIESHSARQRGPHRVEPLLPPR
jgi:hypothetical protein